MSNYENNSNLHVFRFPRGGGEVLACRIADIFDIDGDFKENEECFRDDTTSMGFETESQRCGAEVYEKHKDKDGQEQIEAILEEIVAYSNGNEVFIIGNDNHSGDYSYEITPTNDEFIVSISYIG